MKNSININPNSFVVTEDPNLIIMQQTSGSIIKDLNFDKFYSMKKFAILIRLVSFLEYLQTNNVSYSFSNIFIDKNYEFDIRQDHSDSNYNTMITQSHYKKLISSNQFEDFLFIFEKMFPFLINSDIFDSVDDSINRFTEVKKILYELIVFAIRLDKNILTNKSQRFIEEKEHYLVLTIIQEFLSVQIKNKHSSNTNTVNCMIKSNDFSLKNKKHRGEYIISHEIELILKKEIKQLKFVKEIYIEYKKKSDYLPIKNLNFSLIRDVSPDINLKAYSNKNIFVEDLIQKDLPKIAITESNGNKEAESNQLNKVDLRSSVIKKKKITSKDLDNSEQIQFSKNNILPSISSVVYKSLNFETDESKEKRDLKIINTKMYLDYKKNIILEKKNNVQNIYQSLNKNSVMRSRLDSGKNNIRSILKDYSSFNRDYISRIFSPKQKYAEQFNFFDEKPRAIVKKDFFKDNNLISKNKF